MAQRIQQFPSAYPMGYQNPTQANIEATDNMLKRVKGAINEAFNAQIMKTLLENINKEKTPEESKALANAIVNTKNGNTEGAITELEKAGRLANNRLYSYGDKGKSMLDKPTFMQAMIGKTINLDNLKMIASTGNQIDEKIDMLTKIKNLVAESEKKTANNRIKANEFSGAIKSAEDELTSAESAALKSAKNIGWTGWNAPVVDKFMAFAQNGEPFENFATALTGSNKNIFRTKKGVSAANIKEAKEIAGQYERLRKASMSLKRLKKGQLEALGMLNEEDQKALDWANKNPTDIRAKKIKIRLEKKINGI